MKRLFATVILATLLSIVGMPTIAQTQVNADYIRSIEASFGDVFDELKNAVINKGLVIDYIGNVDQMLERTALVNSEANAEQSKPVYLSAKYMQFCSSTLTHTSVRANPQNLSMCPFVVFIYETHANPGHIIIGYQPPTLSNDEESVAISREVSLFLQGILEDVASNY
ncbi:MAG: hypothetical protein ACI9KN_002153 [Gammaproteobacteria bacterium]|jgi:hypothetical protein